MTTIKQLTSALNTIAEYMNEPGKVWDSHLERRHCVDGEVRLVDQKNRRARSVITICAEAQAIVDRQPIHPMSPYVFNTSFGDRYKTISGMFAAIVNRTEASARRAGIPFTRFRFHDLRHEFAIRYLNAGGSLYRVQKLLRHSTIGQTEWYLSYLTPEQADIVRR